MSVQHGQYSYLNGQQLHVSRVLKLDNYMHVYLRCNIVITREALKENNDYINILNRLGLVTIKTLYVHTHTHVYGILIQGKFKFCISTIKI